LDSGKDAIGLDRLKLLLSAMGKPYRSNRYSHDPKKEKAYLRSKLKAYVRSSMKMAKEVAGLLENNKFENNQGEYYVKEMVRLGLLTYANGMYKYDGAPLAATHIGIIEIWAVEPGTKDAHLNALKEAQELELFKK